MNVRVKLFAAARELAGLDELVIEVEEPANVCIVRRAVAAAWPVLTVILPHCLWAVDAQYAGDDHPICENSDVALIPPVSGG